MLERITSMDGTFVVERFEEKDSPRHHVDELTPPNFFERLLSSVDSDNTDGCLDSTTAEINVSTKVRRTKLELLRFGQKVVRLVTRDTTITPSLFDSQFKWQNNANFYQTELGLMVVSPRWDSQNVLTNRALAHRVFGPEMDTIK